MPIVVDLNGKEEVAETDSRNAKKTINISARAYKPMADGKPPKCQRKITSTIWEHYECLKVDEDCDLFCKCKKCDQVYREESKHGIGNLKRHLGNCKKRNFRYF